MIILLSGIAALCRGARLQQREAQPTAAAAAAGRPHCRRRAITLQGLLPAEDHRHRRAIGHRTVCPYVRPRALTRQGTNESDIVLTADCANNKEELEQNERSSEDQCHCTARRSQFHVVRC